jgi:hypothetical protein
VGESKAKLDLDKVPAANVRRLRDERLWRQEELARRNGSGSHRENAFTYEEPEMTE